MVIVIKIMILAALVKLLIQTEKPFLCAGIMAAVSLFFGLLFGHELSNVLLNVLITLAVAALYFWLLDRFRDGWLFWAIAIVGALLFI